MIGSAGQYLLRSKVSKTHFKSIEENFQFFIQKVIDHSNRAFTSPPFTKRVNSNSSQMSVCTVTLQKKCCLSSNKPSIAAIAWNRIECSFSYSTIFKIIIFG